MGQALKKLKDKPQCAGFPDLAYWPPELSLQVLSHLNATDLCLAACVWQGLAQDQILWQSLCRSQWGFCNAYDNPKPEEFSYHKLYMLLDEGTVTFNADAETGMEYFHNHQLIVNHPTEIAKFLYHTHVLNSQQLHAFLSSRRDILDKLISMYNFQGELLCDALRRFLENCPRDQPPSYLHVLIEKFSVRFTQCNPKLGLSSDMVYILCFSLLMLSVDLSSPHIKNKMSKREFIRNVRNAIRRNNDDLFGHLYDDVYLRGHIALARSNHFA